MGCPKFCLLEIHKETRVANITVISCTTTFRKCKRVGKVTAAHGHLTIHALAVVCGNVTSCRRGPRE